MNKKEKKKERKKQMRLQKLLNKQKKNAQYHQETPVVASSNQLSSNLDLPNSTSAKKPHPKVADKPKVANRPESATLIFNAYAWAKLNYLRDKGDTEVGAFGITLRDSPLTVVDVVMVKQKATCASIKFDDIAVADFFEDQVEAGRQPLQFARIWLHTHPGNCATPSTKDEDTFENAFGRCDWAVMAILANGGDSSARLRYNVGIRAEFEIKMKVDWKLPFFGTDYEAWDEEYDRTLEEETATYSFGRQHHVGFGGFQQGCFMGHMPNSNLPDDTEDWRHMYDPNYEPDYKKNTISGKDFGGLGSLSEKGITVIDHTEDNEIEFLDPDLEDEPGVYWPLERELETMTRGEQAELLTQLELKSDEAKNYICWYNKRGVLIAQYDPEAADADFAEFEQAPATR